jgi:hypothetical protein
MFRFSVQQQKQPFQTFLGFLRSNKSNANIPSTSSAMKSLPQREDPIPETEVNFLFLMKNRMYG